MPAWESWRDDLALWIPVLTFVVLAIHPVPECVHCEEWPNPWGRDDVAYARDGPILAVGLIVTSFVVGLFALKWRWLVPLGMVSAHLATQPIGGVSLVSLSNNEGPIILLLGLPVGYARLVLGDLARLAFKHFGSPNNARSAARLDS